jgi:hypothetical protein
MPIVLGIKFKAQRAPAAAGAASASRAPRGYFACLK